MKKHPPPGAIRRARSVRNNPTDAERNLWSLLREKFPDARFRRQVPIQRFICDFASHRFRLIIEADGGHHGGKADRRRDMVLEREGYRVLRFWNSDILSNPEGVAERIRIYITDVPPHP